MVFIKVFISIIIFTVSGINLSLIEIKMRNLIIWIFCITTITSIFAIFSEMLAGIVSIILVVYMLYKISKKFFISIFYTIISMVLSVISDNVISSIIRHGFENGETIRANLDSNIILYVVVSLFVFLLVFSFSKVLGQVFHKKHLTEMITSNKRIGFVLSSFMIIVFSFIYASVFLDFDSNPLIILGVYILYFTFVLLVLTTLIAVFKKENTIINKNMELDQLRKYTENVEILYNDMRKARHDYMNVLSSLISYIDKHDMNGLEKYFNSEIIPFSKKLKNKDSKLGLLSHIKTLEVKSIIAIKTINALEQGVKVNLEIKEDIVFSSIDIIDLCRILGILLDNALEAAIDCEKATINIALIKSTKSIITIITNNIIEGKIPIHKIYEQGYSTKGEKRGLGLSNLREIINSYSNINIDTIVENFEFQQILEIVSND